MNFNKYQSLLSLALISHISCANDTVNLSAIINLGYTDRADFNGISNYGVGEHAQGLKNGFWTEHSELSLSSAIDDMFFGKMSLVLDEHEGETEVELEEAFIQTTALPYNLSFRAGRFLSNVGYLNSKHGHTDAFADRPLVYRTFMNGHYYDDGARFSWLAPTDIYLEVGTELFKGGKMPAYADKNVGAHSFFVKSGGDFSIEHSWQLGASYLSLNNDEGACSSHADHEDEHEDEHDEHDDHDEHEEHESFSACDFAGEKHYYLVDATWKWAPNGNYKYQNFTFSTEWFFVEEEGELHHEDEEIPVNANHQGYYISGVYQFSPNWAAGLRYSEVSFDAPYDEDFSPSISSAMIEYRHSHFSNVRLQYSQDKSTEDMTDDQITLQFTMALGAHNAHQY